MAKLDIPFWRSLRTRITLAVLLLVVLSLSAVAFVTLQALRANLQQKIAAQQFSAASLVADGIERGISLRLHALQAAAQGLELSTTGRREGIGSFLERQGALERLFNRGLAHVQASGRTLAVQPAGLSDLHLDLRNCAPVQRSLAEGLPVIAGPVTCSPDGDPLLLIAVPTGRAGERGRGALIGIIHLAEPSFLQDIGQSRYGNSGGYLVVSRSAGMIIAATESERSLKPAPAAGVNLQHDRYMSGFEGSGVARSSLGVDELSSAKQISLIDWFAVARLPVAEAFAPIAELQSQLFLLSSLSILIVGGGLWIILQRQLAPICRAAEHMQRIAKGSLVFEAMPIDCDDELGVMGASFNALLVNIAEAENAMRESERRFRELADAAPVLIWMAGTDAQCNYFNHSWLAFTGRSLEQESGDGWTFGLHPEDWKHCLGTYLNAFEAREEFVMEYRLRNFQGKYRWLLDHGVPRFSLSGEFLGYIGSCVDITHIKEADDLRIAAAAFQTQEAMLITDADEKIIRVNQSFTQLTGYPPEEVIGKRPNIFRSGRQSDEFYRAMHAELAAKGSWRGEVWNRRKNGDIFPCWLNITALKGLDGRVSHYVASQTDMTERKEAESRIRHLAYFDSLTGLPNRRLLMDRLGQAMATGQRSGHYGALLFIDLDNFKQINDTAGHDIGDKLLMAVSRRLSDNIRACDTVARLGGDEFVIMLEDLGPEEMAAAEQTNIVGTKLLEVLRPAYRLDNQSFISTPSIGAALFLGKRVSVEELMKQADIAMYQAKGRGRNSLCFFDPTIQRETQARAVLEAELRRAVTAGQWLLHYQLQVDSTGRPVGAEVLLRWQHPKRGLVMPDLFIKLAEDTGLIMNIGHQVLLRSCEQLARWASNEKTAHLTLAVNVSVRQFRNPNFVQEVREALESTGARPERLKLELTESMLLEDIQGAIDKMTTLKVLGVSFSLDDFGTGYSSLSYLKRLPFDQIKIDRSFIHDLLANASDAAIARTVIALGHSFGIEVIAEGVESSEQHDFLVREGCTVFQGYFYGRPMPVEDLEISLEQSAHHNIAPAV